MEHGIFVDHKGFFVWLSGNGKGDSMVLKFTQDAQCWAACTINMSEFEFPTRTRARTMGGDDG
jgi:hypothetical protein